MKNKRLIFLLILSVILAAVIFITLRGKESDTLVIKNLSIGSADAAIISYNGKYGMIDTGIAESFGHISGALEADNADKLSFLIISHFDKDHIGNAKKILDQYEVETVFIPDYESEKYLYAELSDKLSKHRDVRRISDFTEYEWDDVRIEFYPAVEKEAFIRDENNRDNNMSLVCVLFHGRNRFLFSGDIEKKRIEEITASNKLPACAWIKMPHHGRYQKALKEFVDMVEPSYAVISCSLNEGIDEKTAELLKQRDVEIYETFKGDVITKSDGYKITIGY